MTKQQQFATLTDKLTDLINNELFISAAQKQTLCDEVFCINARVQAGLMRGIETRLHAVYNTLRAYRVENLFPSLKR